MNPLTCAPRRFREPNADRPLQAIESAATNVIVRRIQSERRSYSGSVIPGRTSPSRLRERGVRCGAKWPAKVVSLPEMATFGAQKIELRLRLDALRDNFKPP